MERIFFYHFNRSTQHTGAIAAKAKDPLSTLLGSVSLRADLCPRPGSVGIRRSRLPASQSAKSIAAPTKAAEAYRQQITPGLDDNPGQANKARVILKDLLGPIQICPGPDGSLWVEFYARPAALVKKAIGTSVGSDGSGGSLCTLATSSEPLAVLEVPLIAA